MEKPPDQHVVEGVDLTGDEYTVKQELFVNKYNVYDGDGTHIMKAKQELLKLKEEFPFTDLEGNTVFRVKAGGILDHSGDYRLSATNKGPIAILHKDFTLLAHSWRVKDPEDGQIVATIKARGVLVELLRKLPLMGFLPHKYSITGPDGSNLGEIAGKLSIRDSYEVTVKDNDFVKKEALAAAAIVIDALEGH